MKSNVDENTIHKIFVRSFLGSFAHKAYNLQVIVCVILFYFLNNILFAFLNEILVFFFLG